MADNLSLHAVTNIGDALTSEQLEENIVSFFQWGLLGAGNFQNVTVGSSGLYGGSLSRLRLCDDPSFNTGQVWEAFRSDWVWESGIAGNTQPIRVSGVYVNGNFHPVSGVGPYAHKINYPLGRVIFDTAIDSGATVTCEYSHRYIAVYPSDASWWKQIQHNSFRADNQQFLQYGSGDWSILSESRIQLPVIIVDAIPESVRRGYEIGSTAAVVNQTVLFHILTENPTDRKRIHDIVSNQWNKTIVAYDKNQLANHNAFPLDENGSPNVSGLMYPDLVKDNSGYVWRKMFFAKMQGIDGSTINTAPLYGATVKSSVDIII